MCVGLVQQVSYIIEQFLRAAHNVRKLHYFTIRNRLNERVTAK